MRAIANFGLTNAARFLIMGHRLERAVLWFCVGMLIVHAYLLWSVRKQVLAGYPDFTAFYAAGRTVRDGRGKHLYDASEQWRTQQQVVQFGHVRDVPLPYLRPPFEALLFVPLTFLPYSQAYLLWNAVGLSIVLGIPLLLRRRIQALQQIPPWLPTLLPFTFTPLFLALLQGQDSILLLLSYTLTYLALSEAEDFRAGCWLGLGLFKPHLVVPVVAILLLQGKRRFALGFLSVAAALFVVSLAVIGWPEILRYPGYVWWLEQHSGRGILPRDTPNLRGIEEGLLAGLLAPWRIILLVSISSIAVILWAARRPGLIRGGNNALNLDFSQAMVATFLVSYHAFAYDLSMMLLPILLLLALRLANHSNANAWSGIALTGPIVLLLFAPIFLLLWLPFHTMNLVAIVLLLWMWGMSREISRLQDATPPDGTVTRAIPVI